MTAETFAEILRKWPGRFQYAELLSSLTRDESARGVATALVDDFGHAATVPEVADRLLHLGRLSAARYLLEGAETVAAVDDFVDRLQAAESDAERRVRVEVKRLQRKIARAGISFKLDEKALAANARNDLSLALARAATIDAEVEAAVRLRSAELQRQAQALADLQHPEVARRWLTEVLGAIDQGALRSAATVIRANQADPSQRGPWFVPFPPTDDLLGNADDALDLVLAKGGGGTAAFRHAFANDRTRSFAQAYRGLNGSTQTAQRLADVLSRLLLDEPTAVMPDLDGVGHMLPFFSLHRDDVMTRLPLGRGQVTLWIGGPDAREVPSSVPGYVMAIGPLLMPSEGRSRIAVIGLSDILRMLRVQVRPQVALMRVAVRQWPIEALIPSDDRAFETLLGSSLPERTATINWLIDLAGFGGIEEADELVHSSGTLPAIVRGLMASRLTELVPDDDEQAWSTEGLVDDERPVLAGLRSVTPAERAVFWAVLWVGEFSEWTPIRDLESLLVLEFDDTQPQVLQRLHSAFDNLAAYSILDVCDGRYRMERWGYVEPLIPRAHSRLRRHLSAMAEAASRSNEDFLLKLGGIVEKLTSHEVKAIQRYQAQTKRPEGKQDLVDSMNERKVTVVDRQVIEPGGFNPITVLNDVQEDIKRGAAGVIVEVRASECPELRISRALFWLIFTELVRNAIEVNDGNCRISISIDVEDEFVTFTVSDTGRGVDPADRARIFRSGFSGRQSSGDGLSLVRQFLMSIGGDIVLVDPDESRGMFSGANFELLVPRLNGTT